MLERLTGGKILIALVVLFVLGIVLGFAIWGFNGSEKIEYKSLLKDAAKYMANLETENIDLLEKETAQANEIKLLRSKNVTAERDLQIKGLEKRVNTLLKSNAALQTTGEENKRLTQANRELKENLQSLISDNQDLSKEAQTVEEIRAENKKLSEQNGQLKTTLGTLTEDRDGFKKEAQASQDLEKRYRDAVKERDALATRAKKMEAAGEALEKEVAELETVQKENKSLERENSGLKKRIKTLLRERDNLAARLKEIKKLLKEAPPEAAEKGKGSKKHS